MRSLLGIVFQRYCLTQIYHFQNLTQRQPLWKSANHYILKQFLAVKVAFVHETLLKSTIAVVPLDFGKVEATVKEIPPAVYADPEVLEISLEVL